MYGGVLSAPWPRPLRRLWVSRHAPCLISGSGTGVCEQNSSFSVSLGHATQQQKLQSSHRFDAFKADFSTCLLIQRSVFSQTGRKGWFSDGGYSNCTGSIALRTHERVRVGVGGSITITSGSCRCAIIGVPWRLISFLCLLFLHFRNNISEPPHALTPPIHLPLIHLSLPRLPHARPRTRRQLDPAAVEGALHRGRQGRNVCSFRGIFSGPRLSAPSL